MLERCLSACFRAGCIGSDTDGIQFIVEYKGRLLGPERALIIGTGDRGRCESEGNEEKDDEDHAVKYKPFDGGMLQ
jgi:hypothetical protein